MGNQTYKVAYPEEATSIPKHDLERGKRDLNAMIAEIERRKELGQNTPQEYARTLGAAIKEARDVHRIDDGTERVTLLSNPEMNVQDF